MTIRLTRLFPFAAWLAGASLAAAPIPVLVELWAPSTVEILQQHGQVSRAELAAQAVTLRAGGARVQREQDDFVAAMRRSGLAAEELYRSRHTINGVAIVAEESRLAALRAMPGVRSVRRLVPKRLLNSSSVPFVGAPAAWDPQGLAATGTGVRVGIIDTGVDYIHTDLGGTGSYSGQHFDDSSVPWTTKVVGGWDFVGDNYTGTNTPRPDGDPMDCNGHGSHVAGTAAGLGVDSDGHTYAGAYSPTTGFSGLPLGPGVAPGAKLYALRIFGCEGSTNMLIPALEWAIDPNDDDDLSDHLDVVNLSLGSQYGSADDPDTEAVDRAVAAGVVVVAAAGNEGDSYFITSSPGVADGAISVASAGDAGNLLYLLNVNSPQGLGSSYVEPASFGPAIAGDDLTGDLVRSDPARGCSALTNSTAMAGKIALIDRGDCLFVVKVKNAQLAGAVAALIANNETGSVHMIGADPSITIPSACLTGADGSSLKSRLPTPGVNVTINKYAYGDVTSDFSSRGPRRGDHALKPDLTAPGSEITSIDVGSGSGSIDEAGTSMSTPHVVGAAAILKGLHPAWPPRWIKAALMNTAVTEVFTGSNRTPPVVGPGRMGAGRLDVARAARTSLLAFADDGSERVSLSFGQVEVLGHGAVERRVRVVNTGSHDVRATLATVPVTDLSGAELALPEDPTLTVPAGGEAAFTVRLVLDGRHLQHGHDPGIEERVSGDPREWLAEETGFITLTPDDGETLTLPYHAAPRPASAMTAELAASASSGAVSLGLSGTGTATGTSFPLDVVPLVSAFELAEVSPDDATSMGRSNMADLRLVGVTTDYPARKALGQTLADSRIYFAIATAAPWSTPAEVRFDVLIDTNRDGKDDYQVVTTSYGAGTDVFVAHTCRLKEATCVALSLNGAGPDTRDTGLLDTNVMVIPVPASLAGLSDTSGRFNYKIVAYTLDDDGQVDVTATHTFDLTKPGLVFGGIGYLGSAAAQPLYEDLPGRTIEAQADATALTLHQSQGIVLIHHHNLQGQRAQVLALGDGACLLRCSAEASTWARPGTPATFTATASGPGCPTPTVSWDFGDGTLGAGTTASHGYAQPGTYSWRLQVESGISSCHQAGTLDVSETPPRIPRRRLTEAGAGS
ncbi:MAG TPA: S8 family serine peptidase [Thermoanaerobaculaceae bacterium]|nr:S8 family serine peptidase [Thermoanaerobaculaceae bacterium]